MKKGLYIFLKLIGFISAYAVILFLTGVIVNLSSQVITNEYILDIMKVFLEIAAAILIVKLFLGRRSIRELGLSFEFDKRVLAFGGLGIIFGSATLLIIFAFGGFTFDRFIWDKLFIEDIIPAILIGLLHSIGTAVSEGITLRGYVFKTLESRNMYLSVALTSLVYALVSTLTVTPNLLTLTGLFLFSAMLSLIYLLTGNLLHSIIFHILWYFSNMYIFSPLASQTYGIIMLNPTEKPLLNGGYSGVWGSLVFITAALVINILMIIKIRSREN